MSALHDQRAKLDQLLAEGLHWFVPDCLRTLVSMEEAIELAQTLSLPDKEAQAQLLLARSCWALGRLSEGHAAVLRLETLNSQLKSPRLNADLEQVRGQLHFAASDYGLALKSWIACLKNALIVRATDLHILACLGIGNVYFAHQQAGEALRWHEIALEFARYYTNQELLAESQLHVVADLNALEQYELVLKLSYKGEQVIHNSGHQAWRADWFSYRGEAYLALQELESAKQCLHRAWEINQQTSYLWSQSLNLLNLGKVYVALHDYEHAADYLEQALSKISTFGAQTLLLRAYAQLAELERLRNDYQRAWQYQRQYHELAVQHARQMAQDKLNTALERRMRELDTQLMVLQTRQENLQLRQQSSANTELLKNLRNASLQDPLTNIGNRRLLDQELPVLYQRCREDLRPLSVLMIDLDHFKAINDNFGHAIGDEVIRSAAQILLQSCRGGDLLVRFGGEEFVLLLPGAVAETAFEVAERIRCRMVEYDWQHIQPQLQASCSIGVVELSDELDGLELLQHADDALYRAKRHGRNCVESYQ
ncbi:diguanylate cyclase [Chitinibacter sp. S2-10]|uniref:GGDEF domain-containing protein n=1 Tax=Chitinibacter sp. S2-10 TaxID=3373597 RepID=UPI0039776914